MTREAAAEPSTDELLEELTGTRDLAGYLTMHDAELDLDLVGHLARLLEVKGLRRSAVIRASEVSETFAYQIFKGLRKPGRDTAIQLAFGFGCTLAEAQRLLVRAGHAPLHPKSRRDAIVIHCLEGGEGLQRTDEMLFRFGEPTLRER